MIKHCEPQGLVAIAMTSCQFMEEVSLSTIICESEHNYKDNTEFSDSVHIGGATVLSIKFDSRWVPPQIDHAGHVLCLSESNDGNGIA